jgi:hypothetical protein
VGRTVSPADFGQTVYFSGTTFATAGYGDFVPAPHARWLAVTEAAAGASFMGLFVVVLGRRLTTA